MDHELLSKIRQPGGSMDEKLQEVSDIFRTSARHLESLQQVLRKRKLEKMDTLASTGVANAMSDEVREVIREGTYLESFLSDFDGQNFVVHSEEIVPGHEYRLALEIHTGGAYWSNIPLDTSGAVRHRVETVSASSQNEGSASVVAQFGSAQRGAVFVWRWIHLPDRGPYDLPKWLSRGLSTEGSDPLRKLQGETEALKRWEGQIKQDTCKHLKSGTELKNPYIREVLRLWPTEMDAQGSEQLKKCAWVEGLDPKLFTGKRVLVHRVQYDSDHALALNATTAMRHQEEPPKEGDPPYRLTTSWHWASQATVAGSTGVSRSLSLGPADAALSTASQAPFAAASPASPRDPTAGRTQELSGLEKPPVFRSAAYPASPGDPTAGRTQELAGLAKPPVFSNAQ